MKIPVYQLAVTLLAASSASAASLTTADIPVIQTFDVAPDSADWSTSLIAVTGGADAWTSAANINSYVATTGFNATTGTSAIGDAGTVWARAVNARWNNVGAIYTASTTGTNGAGVALVATYANNTGASLTGFTLAYDIARRWTDNNGTMDDTPAGRQVYYSLTGSGTDWSLLSSLTSTESNLTNSVPLSSTTTATGTIIASGIASESISGLNWANGGNLHILWIDDNAHGNDLAYTMDNVSLTGTSVVPEPATYGLIGAGALAAAALARRRKKVA